MSELLLVRHGQASAMGDDYDQLSSLGTEQSRALGESWARGGVRFDRYLIGPRRRHRQTYEAVAAAYERRGDRWPEPEVVAAFDEHQGPELFDHYRSELMPEPVAEPEKPDLRRYLQAYQVGTLRWARGELATPPHLESWRAFRARVDAGLSDLVDQGSRGARVVAFTSGGAVAAAAGHALNLADEKIIELSWRVRNAAITELLYSSRRGMSLHTFNATPHLGESRLLTYI